MTQDLNLTVRNKGIKMRSVTADEQPYHGLHQKVSSEKLGVDLPVRQVRPEALPSLTGIRGVAALWVMLHHAFGIFKAKPFPGSLILTRGWSGVDLFFVLSGFILMHAHARDFQRPTIQGIRKYFESRFLRIIPLNLAVTTAITIFLVANGGYIGWRHFTGNLTSNFLVTASALTVWFPHHQFLNQPVWSLSAEIVGYATLPIIAFFIGKTKSSAGFLALASFSILALLQLGLHQVGRNVYTTWPALMRMEFCFFGGAALRQFRASLPSGISQRAGAAAMISVLAIILCCFSRIGTEFQPALYGVLILALSYRRGWIDKILSSAPVLYIGKISFPLYLIHLTILFVFSYVRDLGWVANVAFNIFLFFITSFAIASAFHWGVEKPCHKVARLVLRR